MKPTLTYILSFFWLTLPLALLAQTTDSAALRLTPNWSHLLPTAPNPNLSGAGSDNDVNGGGTVTSFLRMTAGSAPSTVRFVWQTPSSAMGNAILLVRKNNNTIISQSVAATDTAYELLLPTFYTGDRLRVSLRGNTFLLNLNATFLHSLAVSTVTASHQTSQPLATIESVHPRRRTLRSALNTPNTPPALTCNWVRDASTASFLCYRTADIADCLHAPDLEGDAFDACVAVHTAYFTFDNSYLNCGDVGNGNNTAQRAPTVPTPQTRAFAVTPNPFGQQLCVRYSLPSPADSYLALRNVAGEVVWAQQYAAQAAGDYSVYIEAAHLPKGVYFYTFSAGEMIEKGRVLKVE